MNIDGFTVCYYVGSPAKVGGKKLAFARRQILQQSSTLIVHLYFSSTLSLCTFLKKYQKRGSRVRHSVLPLFKSRFATSFSRCTPRRSLLVAMLGVARTRCAQTSCHLFPSIARLLTVPPNAALPPLAGNYFCNELARRIVILNTAPLDFAGEPLCDKCWGILFKTKNIRRTP